MMGMISTKEVAERTGRGRRAVQFLITKGHLPAIKMGRDWFIEERDLRLIENIKPGPKPRKKRKKAA